MGQVQNQLGDFWITRFMNYALWRPNNNTIWLLWIIQNGMPCFMIIWFLAVICPLYSTSSSTDFYSMGGPHKSSPEIATMATWGDRLATRGALEAGRNWQSGFVWRTRTCSWQSVTFCDILWYSVIFWDILWYFEAGLWISITSRSDVGQQWCALERSQPVRKKDWQTFSVTGLARCACTTRRGWEIQSNPLKVQHFEVT
jgi:hypothetical protein